MPTDQPTQALDAARRAREQAAAYKSQFTPTEMTLTYGDGTTEVVVIPPHPNLRMLDDDRLEAYEDLLFEAETTYDRYPDTLLPEQKLDNGIIIPAETKQGAIKRPYQRTTIGEDGRSKTERIKPAWEIQVVETCIGKDVLDKIRGAVKTSWREGDAHEGHGTGSQADVWRVWSEQGLELTDRATVDPKSVRSGSAVAAVPRGNS